MQGQGRGKATGENANRSTGTFSIKMYLTFREQADIIKMWKPRTVATSNLNPQSVSRNYLHNAVSRLFAPDGLLLSTRAYFENDREDEPHDARDTAQVAK